jgi:hypothetical protein
MRVGPIIHGALLTAALVFAYQTWTREPPSEPKGGTVTVWKESVDRFQSMSYDGDNKSLLIERRGEGPDAYHWGTVSRSRKAPRTRVPVKNDDPEKAIREMEGGHGPDDGHGHGPDDGHGHGAPPAAPKGPTPQRTTGAPKGPQSPHRTEATDPAAEAVDTAEAGGDGAEAAEAPALPEPEMITTTKEFPLGEGGAELIANLSHLRALRDLGKLSDAQKDEYGLSESKESLKVFFQGGVQRSLVLGGKVIGGSDRYAMDPDSGKGYVLAHTEVTRHFDTLETSLGLKELHAFMRDPEDSAKTPRDPKVPRPKKDKYRGVRKIHVATPDASRDLLRADTTDPQGAQVLGWASADAPDRPDLSYSNFLSQVERLKPVDYLPDVDEASLTRLLTIEYRSDAGKVLGTFEFFKREKVSPLVAPGGEDDAKDKDEVEYFVKTELTRIPGKVSKMSAERVEQDIPQLVEGREIRDEDGEKARQLREGLGGTRPVMPSDPGE